MGGYYSWMSGRRVCMTADSTDMTLAEHDKQYHKEGYKEGDKCKLREETIKQDDLDSEEVPLSLSEIKELLKTKYGVTLCDYEEANKIVSKEGSEGFNGGWEYAEKATKEEVRETASRVLEVLDNLKTRFGYTPQLDYLFCVRFRDFEGKAVGGLSEIDRIYSDFSKMAINVWDIPWSGKSFGHNDKRAYKNAIIRHEIGHVISTDPLCSDFLDACLFNKRNLLSLGKNMHDVNALMESITSKSAFESTNKGEQLAEMFSRYTDEETDRLVFPECFRILLENILSGEYDNA